MNAATASGIVVVSAAMTRPAAREARNVRPIVAQVVQRLRRAHRQADQENHLARVYEHDAHREERRPPAQNVVRERQRACQVQVYHPVAAVGAQQFRRDDGGEQEEYHPDYLVVVRVSGDFHRNADGSLDGGGYYDEHDRRRHDRAEEQDGQYLGERPASYPERGAYPVDEQSLARPRTPLARAVVAAIAQIKELAVGRVHGALSSRNISARRWRRGPSRRSLTPVSTSASRMASYSSSPTPWTAIE